MGTEAYEPPMRCTQNTAEWFKQNFSKPEEPSSTEGGGSTTTVPLEYQSHYSRTKNGCFAQLSQLSSFKGDQRSKLKDYIVVTHTLWDVNQKSRLGVYAVRDVEAMTACDMLGAKCVSKEQWLEMAKPYLTE